MGIGATFKRMVVVVILLAALSSESGMTDNSRGILREVQLHFMRWLSLFESNDVSVVYIADTCCICSSAFCGNR